ncbi:hypothetical protein [Sediminibacillus albus]|uniref:Uncharacterized protein n=1 Tax=Sediminibacillus albus TaxID=407036 RepID=A0A1G9B5I8_9BACI|nr:hypothetical protein [Sediminibacillus albus]SDK34776.1 hypothetical protein SAMN05216243_2824 [Sediminibacillus albus]
MKFLKELGWILLVTSILILIPLKVFGPLQIDEENPATEADKNGWADSSSNN